MNSVVRVAAVAQVTVGYFENTVVGKITEPWVAVFWNVYLATSERRGACNITNNVSFSQNIQHSRNKHDNSHYRLYKIINTRL